MKWELSCSGHGQIICCIVYIIWTRLNTDLHKHRCIKHMQVLIGSTLGVKILKISSVWRVISQWIGSVRIDPRLKYLFRCNCCSLSLHLITIQSMYEYFCPDIIKTYLEYLKEINFISFILSLAVACISPYARLQIHDTVTDLRQRKWEAYLNTWMSREWFT